MELKQSRREDEDRTARAHRYRVSGCRIDDLEGGAFSLEAEGLAR